MLGTEYSSQIRNNGYNIPVILCSGTIEPIPKVELQQYGIRSQLAKPIDVGLRLKSIRQLIKTI